MVPSWMLAVKAVVQPLAGALPALILVIFVGFLGLVALACQGERRTYALEYAEKFISLARVLIGVPSEPASR
ncbi:hypothetical protein [Catenuloplanes japonicus]|uniref:hypothetical protein n=1 Tax=Catenuloplanes japonicus TaxID=33876 RepID=UPI0005253E98|nr:hypothetical protein [Catenuloplanes japonicus]